MISPNTFRTCSGDRTRSRQAHLPAEPAAEETGAPLDRSLSYLHAAYEVGVDQLRVVDEIIRIAAAHERTTDCLAALDVKAELLELQADGDTLGQGLAALLDAAAYGDTLT